MIDRRDFLARTAAAALAPALSPVFGQRPAGGLRTITYNVLACNGYPRTKENEFRRKRARPQIPVRIAFELLLYEPDIVTFQESPSKAKVAAIAKAMGMNHAYFPGGFPGAVITKFEIKSSKSCPLASGEREKDLFTRHWGKAVLAGPNGDLALYTAHLHPNSEAKRKREVTAMLHAMDADLSSGRDVILQGDLNHDPDGPEYARWKNAGLVDAFAVAGAGQKLTIPSTKPRQRIDYVWCKGPLAARVENSRVLFEGGFRTNPDDPASFALSDHIPVLASFKGS